MPAERIDGGKATLELLPNGILHLEWDRDSTITAEDAAFAMAAVDALVGAEGHPMLVDMETTRTVTRGARAVFAIPCSASRIALLGSSPVDRMLANFFLGVNSPPCPTKFFTSRHMAVAWLQSAAGEQEHPASA
ncbi:STAS/SEC14 domain-containing protein [Arthrobacter bussei]|uniref:STAS/SEC14 domain-containing protein n=1 Tax=Arthrobacter bussei TaxID=2594179 RepID=A0A7X1NPN4_9MICC|nr:STAS/SEC14 domain-containing protein [Arthrobacter bussei]MPY10594.1 STAS/SEC14 domain-containing protein [Arthrobacter bussei]